MARKLSANIDFVALQAKLQAQFSGLDPNDPSRWPIVPKASALLGIFLAVFALLWYLWLDGLSIELEADQQKEVELRKIYVDKLSQAINLDSLKKQLEEVRQYVNQLEKQLPSKAEMDALLSDINQAGLGRSLQFELFRPGQVIVKEYYAELPISVKITGGYHDVGLFASDIAHLSRIVTLSDIQLSPMKDKPSQLTLEGVAKTFRYLDLDEVDAQRKAKDKKVGP
ncbi:MAG: type 4a pilus biogenesis protein PilO [Burkholderiales bacterium]|nr:type 4a pilus biogenesis protein PilO [Burkholderiales bacterium]